MIKVTTRTGRYASESAVNQRGVIRRNHDEINSAALNLRS